MNWEAAGEYGDDFSDDDDELIEEELRVGNVTGYRRQLNTSKHSKPKKGKAAAKSAATGSGSGSGSGSSAAGGAHNSSKAPAQAPAESAAPRHSKGKGGAAGAGKADKGGLPRRVPKTPDNPKGRHRLAKPEDFAAATGKGAKGPKGAKYTKGAAAAGKAGNKFNKAGVKPKSEKAPRRRYY